MKDKAIEIKTSFMLLEDGTVRFSFPYDGPFLSLRELQSERITNKTTLLYFVYRDREGIHSGWAWDKQIRNLYSFLYNELMARAISLEYDVSRRSGEGFRSVLRKVGKKIANDPSSEGTFPESILTIVASSFLLECDATRDFSLGDKILPLEEVAGKLFYFVSIEFFEGFESALEEIKRHKKLSKRSSLRTNLISDTSISYDF